MRHSRRRRPLHRHSFHLTHTHHHQAPPTTNNLNKCTHLGIQFLPHTPRPSPTNDPHHHISNQTKHQHSHALIPRSHDLRHGAHTHHTRPRAREQLRLTARLIRRSAHPRIRALRQRLARQFERVGGAEGRETERARVGVREGDEASARWDGRARRGGG
jgi:hypothetical protein